MLRSDLCILVMHILFLKELLLLQNQRGFIDTRNRFLASKNNAPFTNCESKTNNVLIDNTEDLDVVIPMYNLLEYGKNYKKTKGSLSNELLHLNYLNYYRVEPNNLPTTNYNDNKF